MRNMCSLMFLWPDFNADIFAAAINDYCSRERRYGGVGDNVG